MRSGLVRKIEGRAVRWHRWQNGRRHAGQLARHGKTERRHGGRWLSRESVLIDLDLDQSQDFITDVRSEMENELGLDLFKSEPADIDSPVKAQVD
jgi:hypothetical protein